MTNEVVEALECAELRQCFDSELRRLPCCCPRCKIIERLANALRESESKLEAAEMTLKAWESCFGNMEKANKRMRRFEDALVYIESTLDGKQAMRDRARVALDAEG